MNIIVLAMADVVVDHYNMLHVLGVLMPMRRTTIMITMIMIIDEDIVVVHVDYHIDDDENDLMNAGGD